MRSRNFLLILCLIAVFAVMPVILPTLTLLGEPVAAARAYIDADAPAIQPLALAGDLSLRGPPIA
ncbi:MAG: hypothetical protein ACTHQM_18705 [Thermoanaerobaculia bacterium]